MLRKIGSIAVLFAVIAVFGAHSRAEGYVGAIAGPSFNNESVGTSLSYGAHAGMKLIPGLNLGVYGTYEKLASVSISVLGVTAEASSTLMVVAAEGNYHLLGEDGLYLGGKIGLGMTSVKTTVTGQAEQSSSTSGLAFAPALGYSSSLAPGWGLQTEVAYMIFGGGSSLKQMKLLAAINYMF